MSLGRLETTLTDVRYSGEREGPMDLPIEARVARLDPRLGERQVSRLAGALPAMKGAQLTDGGLHILLVAGVTFNAALTAKNGDLVLKPETPVARPEPPLTPGGLLGAVYIKEVHIRRSAVVLEGQANGLGI